MGDPITQRGTNFNPSPCTPQQNAANWGKVGDTVHNLQEQITNLTEIIEQIAIDVCNDLENCELDLPDGFPETEPPTVENVIQTIWNILSDCCGEGGNFCESVDACLSDFCERVEECLEDPDICEKVRECVYADHYYPEGPNCGEEEFCWDCLEVVTDTDYDTDINNVVYPIDIADRVVTDVEFDEETCELTVDYYDQSYDVWQIEYVTEVTDEKELIFAGVECPPVDPPHDMDENERRSAVHVLPEADGTIDAGDRRHITGQYRRFS